jgi:hypothetical protein
MRQQGERVEELKDRYAIHTSGLHDCMSICEEAVANTERKTQYSAEGGYERTSFTKTRDWAHCLELARTGWDEGRGKLQTEFDKLHGDGDVPENASYSWQEQGEFFDMGAVMSGEPECWMVCDQDPKRQVWKITANIGMSAVIPAASATHRGAAIMALVEALQDQGHIVELEAVDGARNWSERYKKPLHITIPLGITPLDLGTAAFVLAHPSMSRRVVYALTEYSDTQEGNSHYGAPWDAPECKTDIAKRTIYIDAKNDTWRKFKTMNGARSWLKEYTDYIQG